MIWVPNLTQEFGDTIVQWRGREAARKQGGPAHFGDTRLP